jgi:hypothetical protein
MIVIAEELLKATEKPRWVQYAFHWRESKEGYSYWECYFNSEPNDPAFDGHRARLCEMYFEAMGKKPRLRVKAGVRKVVA